MSWKSGLPYWIYIEKNIVKDLFVTELPVNKGKGKKRQIVHDGEGLVSDLCIICRRLFIIKAKEESFVEPESQIANKTYHKE